MFEKYSACLDGDYSIDYWSDDGIGSAATFLESFTVSDWNALKSIIQYKPATWLIRCAETLGDVGEGRSIDVLLK